MGKKALITGIAGQDGLYLQAQEQLVGSLVDLMPATWLSSSFSVISIISGSSSISSVSSIAGISTVISGVGVTS